MKPDLIRNGLNTMTQVSTSPILVVVKDNVLHLGGHTDVSTLVMTSPVSHPDIHAVLPPEHAKQMSKVLNKKTELELELDQFGNLVVTQGKSTFVYTTLPIESISYKLLMNYYKEDFLFVVDGELLVKGIQTVLNFSNGDINDVRAKNIHLAIENGNVEVAASNGSSLAVYTFPLTEKIGQEDLPVTLIGRIVSILGKTFPGQVKFGKTTKKMHYKAEDKDFTYKGTFPLLSNAPFAYQPLIAALNSKTNNEKAILEREDFLERAKAVLYFTEDKVKNRVEIQFSPDSVLLQGDNEKGAFELDFTPVMCSISSPMKMSLDYLIRVAAAVANSELSFEVVDNKFFLKDDRLTCVIPQLKS